MSHPDDRAATGAGGQRAGTASRPDSGAEAPVLWRIAASVVDPEMPPLTIADLGMLRGVQTDPGGRVHVQVTPTYSGCPATASIANDLLASFAEHGYRDVAVEFVLAPPWSTDDITPEGRRKLAEQQIAPPHPRTGNRAVALALSARCPRCGSFDTREVSRFGSTACKSLWACNACREPFGHVKAI